MADIPSGINAAYVSLKRAATQRLSLGHVGDHEPLPFDKMHNTCILRPCKRLYVANPRLLYTVHSGLLSLLLHVNLYLT